MNSKQIKAYLDTLDEVLALWWFMENVNEDSSDRQEIFFYLRERVRLYSQQNA